MGETVHSPRFIRFGVFEIDLQAEEVRKSGVRLKLTGQPFQVLAILVERPGEMVTREELQKRLWPDTFVDVEHNLNTAINKIREVLGDSAENPRFVETLPRRGYRFIGSIQKSDPDITLQIIPSEKLEGSRHKSRWGTRVSSYLVVSTIIFLLTIASFLAYKKLHSPVTKQRALTRLTFDEGLQIGVAWSPDARFIAYCSDRGGKFDIWVQQVGSGNPVQVTHSATTSCQPDWSPDGRYLAYRSEDDGGGLFVIPAFGGAGLERKIASFGYYPRWSPDGSQILFQRDSFGDVGRLYVVGLDGNQPREVLATFLAAYQYQYSVRSAAWHPDGKRITVLVYGDRPIPDFWTVPIAGGKAMRSHMDSLPFGQVGEVSLTRNHGWGDRKFSWASSGRAIYYEYTFGGARNLWRMSVDPETLQALAVERLTTGPGLDTDFVLSRDEKRLAFTAQSEHFRIWRFPFDAARGRLTGAGHPVTSSGMEAWSHTLTRDGKKLAFVAIRAGRLELWEKSLVDGREGPVVPDDKGRARPVWSPDGMRLAYWRGSDWAEKQLFVWSRDSHREEPVTALSALKRIAYDWSPDGKGLLISEEASDTHLMEIWMLPVAPGAESAARKIISYPGYDLWQPHFSPNGKWIAFNATRNTPTAAESRLYVTRALGGPNVPITGGKYFDDKPRWSPDGRTIYFASNRAGFYNVWGIRFDPTKGKPVGEPFRVTDFGNPGLMIPGEISQVEISLDHASLFVNLIEASGSIWMLENFD